eukprot:26675-Amphidinium_carterae.1
MATKILLGGTLSDRYVSDSARAHMSRRIPCSPCVSLCGGRASLTVPKLPVIVAVLSNEGKGPRPIFCVRKAKKPWEWFRQQSRCTRESLCFKPRRWSDAVPYSGQSGGKCETPESFLP